MTVNRHDGLPAHVGDDINLIGHRALAGVDIPRVDDDVGIDFAFPRLVGQVEEVDAEVDAAVTASGDIAPIAEGKCNDIARVVGVIPGAVNIRSRMRAALPVFIEGEKVLVAPVCEFSDGDRTFALPASDDGGLCGMRSVEKLIQVADSIVVGVAKRPVRDIACSIEAFAEGSVVERVEAILNLPAVGKAVAIGVAIEWIGLGPKFSRIMDAVFVGVPIDEAIGIFVLTVAVLQAVFIRVGLRGAGLRPSLAGVDFIVRPRARQPWLPCRIDGNTIAIRPSIFIGILNPVGKTVPIGVGIGRIGHRAGSLAGAVVALGQVPHPRHLAAVCHDGI